MAQLTAFQQSQEGISTDLQAVYAAQSDLIRLQAELNAVQTEISTLLIELGTLGDSSGITTQSASSAQLTLQEILNRLAILRSRMLALQSLVQTAANNVRNLIQQLIQKISNS
jgi:hypothetical protein